MVFASKAHMLFDDGHHKCMVFSELVKGSGIQANQLLILDGKHMPVQKLDYIFASHQDPDIIASLGRQPALLRHPEQDPVFRRHGRLAGRCLP